MSHVLVEFADVGSGLRVTAQVVLRGTLAECRAREVSEGSTRGVAYRLLTDEEWEAMRQRLAPGVEVADDTT